MRLNKNGHVPPCHVVEGDFAGAMFDIGVDKDILPIGNRQNVFLSHGFNTSVANLVEDDDGLGYMGQSDGPFEKQSGPFYTNQVAQYSYIIEDKARKYGIPPQIIGNIIRTESSGNATAYRGVGENSRGLMQLTEATARDLGFTGDFDDLYDPEVNIEWGVKLLSKYRDMEWKLFDSDTPMIDRWKVITSAYNQGPSYGINALKQLTMRGTPTTWENVLWYMTTHK